MPREVGNSANSRLSEISIWDAVEDSLETERVEIVLDVISLGIELEGYNDLLLRQ